ncbi:hypothetical protein F441_20030, partial [Phytophthora nicotianae CJ01A1]
MFSGTLMSTPKRSLVSGQFFALEASASRRMNEIAGTTWIMSMSNDDLFSRIDRYAWIRPPLCSSSSKLGSLSNTRLFRYLANEISTDEGSPLFSCDTKEPLVFRATSST